MGLVRVFHHGLVINSFYWTCREGIYTGGFKLKSKVHGEGCSSSVCANIVDMNLLKGKIYFLEFQGFFFKFGFGCSASVFSATKPGSNNKGNLYKC